MTDSYNEKICNGNEMSTHGILNEQFICFDYGEQVQMNLHLKQQKMKTLM